MMLFSIVAGASRKGFVCNKVVHHDGRACFLVTARADHQEGG